MGQPVVAWLERPTAKLGLDNLGTQQPCVAIYTKLLPGITNVTDRAIYFGFYPWFTRAFAQRFPKASEPEFRNALRRADCLVTLAAERHGIVAGDNDDGRHSATCPGRQKLGPAAQEASSGSSLDITVYANRDEDNLKRYFKNPLGGLGQYYLGPLRDEYDVFRGNPTTGLKYTLEYGEPLAVSYADGLDEVRFFEALAQDSITANDLDDLAEFCPCALHGGQRSVAQNSLIDLILHGQSSGGLARRSTFQLLFEFLEIENGSPSSNVVKSFLGACYAGSVTTGPWPIPEHLETVRRKWALYVRNEMMSLAWSTLFKTALDELNPRPMPFHDVRDLADWLLERPSFSYRSPDSFEAMVKADRAACPALEDRDSPDHELALWARLTEERNPPVEAAARMLIRLVARWGNELDSYSPLEFPPGSLSAYPLTLDSLNRFAATKWKGQGFEAWLKGLLVEVLVAHQRIAIRKLGQSGEDTLMFRSGDAGMFVHRDLDRVVETQPRLRQALQISRDLGLTEPTPDHLPRLTELGLQQLQRLRA